MKPRIQTLPTFRAVKHRHHECRHAEKVGNGLVACLRFGDVKPANGTACVYGSARDTMRATEQSGPARLEPPGP